MSKSVLNRSFYKPGRGGHALGDVRNAFLEAIEAYEAWEDGEPEHCVEVRERPMRLSEVCGLLWNCSDTMPGIDRDHLEGMLRDQDVSCGSYARAARALKDAIGRALARDAAAKAAAQSLLHGAGERQQEADAVARRSMLEMLSRPRRTVGVLEVVRSLAFTRDPT